MALPDRRIAILFLIIIALALNGAGCGQQSPQKKPAPQQKAQKPPPELEKMKKDLAELGTMLEKRRNPEVDVSSPIAQTQNKKQGQSKQQGQQGGNDSQSGGQSQAQGGGSEKKQSEQAQQAAGQEREWQAEMKLVRSLHEDWNGLEAEAIAKGMSSAAQAALEENLCRLTRAVENREALEAELAANQVYRYYIEAAARFKTGIPPDLERIRYHVAETRLQGEIGSWGNAEEEAMRAMEIWRRLSYSLDKIDRQMLAQTEHSLTDLVDVVAERSNLLTAIKTEIALQNINRLERQVRGTMAGS